MIKFIMHIMLALLAIIPVFAMACDSPLKDRPALCKIGKNYD